MDNFTFHWSHPVTLTRKVEMNIEQQIKRLWLAFSALAVIVLGLGGTWLGITLTSSTGPSPLTAAECEAKWGAGTADYFMCLDVGE